MFIRVLFGSFGAPKVSSCSFRFILAGRRSTQGVVGFLRRALAFIRARPGGRGVHWGSLGSLGRAVWVVWFILVRCGRTQGIFRTRHWVHSGSFWFAIWVVGLFPVHSDTLFGSSGSFVFFRFILALP